MEEVPQESNSKIQLRSGYDSSSMRTGIANDVRGMKVISLFDGISCGQLALHRAGVKYDKYYASEIDRHAMKIAEDNYPNTIQLGPVEFVTANQFAGLGEIGLLLGGSPCTGLSRAGKCLNFEDEGSKLFFDFVRLLNTVKPKYFLLENVLMKQEHRDIVSDHLRVDPIEINSNLLSAQNRRRLYWTNIPGVEQPEEKGLLVKDILDPGSPREELYLNKIELERAAYKYKGKVWKSGNRMGNMKFPDGHERKAKTICKMRMKGSRETHHIQDKKGIRVLSVTECEKLQTLPVDYTKAVSNHQRYAAIGNAWTVDVIAHILSFIP